ncbi:MAG: aminotransferase class III-fold pyridoxal phosphate-dependent enzyme [Planctomycetota bacterium]
MIETKYRRIVSPVPHPGSLPLIEELRRLEPRSMAGMPPVVWDRAEGFQVRDPFGNCWIDFSSAVVVANAGHANPRIDRALREQLDRRLLHNYCNPSEIRLRAVKTLLEILPPYLDKVFLLSTGSEAVECAIKLARLHGRSLDPRKYHVVSFHHSFHGRTMAAQAAGGFPDQQEWMGAPPPGFHHVPFPDCPRCPWGKTAYHRCGRECLDRALSQLAAAGLDENLVAAVITETFQGPTVAFLPDDYVRALRDWTESRSALLIFDEIQAGFGRTGRWWGFEHYRIEPDLVALGKGMTSSLPMSAVAGRGRLLDLAPPGSMSSTHTGNPLCCAALIANVASLREDRLVENAAALEPVVRAALEDLRTRFAPRIGNISGKGLVWAVCLIDPATDELDVPLAERVTARALELGLFMLQTHRGTLKIAPPLCITGEALLDGVSCIADALEQSLAAGPSTSAETPAPAPPPRGRADASSEKELDELLKRIADLIDLDRCRRLDDRYLASLAWKEVDRPPLVVDAPFASALKLPPPWDSFRRYSYSRAFDSPPAMLQNQLLDRVVPGLLLGDDSPLAIRNNHGTIQMASFLGARWKMHEDNYPWVEPFSSRDRIREIVASRTRLTLDRGVLPRSFDTLAFYREKLERHPPADNALQISIPDLQGPLDTAEQLWGSDIYLASYDEPELLDSLLTRIVTAMLFVAEGFYKLAQNRLDPVATTQHGYLVPGRLLLRGDSSILLSADMYEELILPHDAWLLCQVGAGSIHFCGNGQHLVDKMLVIPDLMGLDFGEPFRMDIPALYARCAERRVALTHLMPSRDDLVSGKARADFPTGCVFSYETADFDDAREVVTRYVSA